MQKKSLKYQNISNFVKYSKITAGILSRKYTFTGPYRIIIDICNKCELGCIMCFKYSPLLSYKKHPSRKWKKLYIPLDILQDLLQELISVDAKSIWICGGGEPFQHPDIYRIIKMIKQAGLECAVFTNGIHINRKNISFLKTINLDKIILSVHAGDADTYKKIHPLAKQDYFKKITDWLEYLKYLKKKTGKTLPKIWFRSVITNYNYNRVDEIIKFAQKQKVDFIEFKTSYNTSGLFKNKLSLDKKQTKFLISNLNRYQNNLNILNNITSFITTLTRINKYFQNKKISHESGKKVLCYKPWFNSVILADGTVLGCSYKQKKLGNINKEKFNEIWHSKNYFNFRKNLKCAPCSAASLSKPLNFMHKLIFQ